LQTAWLSAGSDVGLAMAYLKIEGMAGFTAAMITTVVLIAAIGLYISRMTILFSVQSGHAGSNLLSALKWIILPALIGAVMTIPFRIMPWDRAIYPFTSLITWLPWALLFPLMISGKQGELDTSALAQLNKLQWVPLAIFILLLLFFQLVLAPGLVL
jgi:hypothetical protein